MILLPEEKKDKIKKGLYVISTPIGNLKDITLRALEVLKNSDFILCEDTRVSRNLLEKYKIKSKLISNHKFNEKKNLTKIIEILKSESVVSLISDAGTPCISDPGGVLIQACSTENISVFPIPGPSAVSTAISISGFSEKYFFYGFFPEKQSQLERDFEKLLNYEGSVVFFISPRKFNKSVNKIKKYFTGREILICREMTKFYEDYKRTSVDKLLPFNIEPKGEITLVISENKNDKKKSPSLKESDKKSIQKMIKKFSTKDIIDLMSLKSDVPKKIIYDYCLKLKNEK
tara:strand:+ start:977 stop:1840 length:864 start_codon:yes stop_codon:yes gene_type:complete